jgi:hypothetical protein
VSWRCAVRGARCSVLDAVLSWRAGGGARWARGLCGRTRMFECVHPIARQQRGAGGRGRTGPRGQTSRACCGKGAATGVPGSSEASEASDARCPPSRFFPPVPNAPDAAWRPAAPLTKAPATTVQHQQYTRQWPATLLGRCWGARGRRRATGRGGAQRESSDARGTTHQAPRRQSAACTHKRWALPLALRNWPRLQACCMRATARHADLK